MQLHSLVAIHWKQNNINSVVTKNLRLDEMDKNLRFKDKDWSFKDQDKDED